MEDLPGGIRRLTFPLPLGIRHVHCYLLPGEDGWTLVDTGLGLPDAEARWAPVLEEAEIARIVVTHFHPDHLGGGEDAQALTGARVLQGALDYEQCLRVWGRDDWSERLADYLLANGLPETRRGGAATRVDRLRPFIRFARDPEPLREGDDVDGWEVLELPGHADGHICLLQRTACSSPATTCSARSRRRSGSTPTRGPTRSATTSRRSTRTIELAPRLALPGPRRADRTTRSRAPARSSSTTAGGSTRPPRRSAAEPRTGFEVSVALFGESLDAERPPLRPRRDARAPRTARFRRPGRADGGRRDRRLY